MKLKREFITHESGGESLLVPTDKAGFAGLVKGNKTLGAILELLKQDITEEEIVASMKRLFEAPEGAVERDVRKALDALRGIGALDE